LLEMKGTKTKTLPGISAPLVKTNAVGDKSKIPDDADKVSHQMKKLTKHQLRAFRDVFESFDLEKSGTLTATELHQCINELAGYQALTFGHVLEILNELDVKGTGDIEFDEFIFFMTRPQNLEKMVFDEDKKQIESEMGRKIRSRRSDVLTPEEILFDIMHRVLQKANNTEIRNFYRQQILKKMDDNVINDWSDADRCIGLSYREIIKRYKIIAHQYRKDQSFKKYLDSPYAKPNRWGIGELKRDIQLLEQKVNYKPKTTKEPKLARVKVAQMAITVEAVPLPVYRVKKQGQRFTYDDVAQIRENVAALKKEYYSNLQEWGHKIETEFHEGLAIDKIRNKSNRRATKNAFESYSNPFVISPWVPQPCPTSWRNSISAPVGKPASLLSRFRQMN